MNPTEWNLKGYTGFIWGGATFITFAWAYFRLPETKGRSFNEIDILFAKKVSARKFAKQDVNAFDENEIAETIGKAKAQQ
jgi:SP family general alpha glucoside:H+ symporter-like MFS transporter